MQIVTMKKTVWFQATNANLKKLLMLILLGNMFCLIYVNIVCTFPLDKRSKTTDGIGDMSFLCSTANGRSCKESIANDQNLTFATFWKVLSTTRSGSQLLSDKKIVIFIAYMRSGSTFASSLLQEYPGTFYVFEPIRMVTKSFKSQSKYMQINHLYGINREYTLDDRQRITENEIDAWLTCNLKSVSFQGLADASSQNKNRKLTETLYKCLNTSLLFAKYPGNMTDGKDQRKELYDMMTMLYDRLQQTNEDAEKIDVCLDKAISSCQESSLIVLKFVRLRMNTIENLIRKYPNMKIIHLVRDPRGIMNSMHKRKRGEREEELCKNLLDDLQASTLLVEKYSKRIKMIKYEDLTRKPTETLEELANFTNLKLTKHMYNFLDDVTHSSAKQIDPFSIKRHNSTQTALNWRLKIDLQFAVRVYNKCKEVNEILGYLPLDTLQELRDLRLPSLVIPNKDN